jgi:diguanylate cyclase (GGDEF)-like protein
MRRLSTRLGTGTRLFAAFAVLALLPVLALGVILGAQYQQEVQLRGVAQGGAQAEVIGRLMGETLLDGHDLRSGLTAAEHRRVTVFSDQEARGGFVRRLRLHGTDQHVIFTDDGSGTGFKPDEEVADALEGETVAWITRLNTDANDVGPVGERVVEVYVPLHARGTGKIIGVLEIYLPYDAIDAELTAGLHRLYLALAFGLSLLYVVLAGLASWMARRLGRQTAEYQHLALHDQLTGLPNRALFMDRIAAAVATARREGGGAAVVLIDLDRFKEVNDTLGHQNGDALLTCLAARLSDTVRDVDTVARLGGDEFGLVLPGVSEPIQAASTLARIHAVIEREVELAGLPLSVEASVGVAFIPRDGQDPDVLLQHADVAMYLSKRAQVDAVYYDPAQDDYNAERLALVAELRHALEREELVLHYQPQVSQPDGEVHTVEALVRWQHPTRGLLAPEDFVPVAEHTGLIDPLTRWVLDTALADQRAWREEMPDLVVAVNISARSLQRQDFPQLVLDALARADAEPDGLLLEITETALVTDAARAAEVLDRLDAAGLRLSLDDFGQGYTSLGQLRQLPLCELKIDKSFVQKMLDSRSDAAIVRSVVELGHNLGMDVVAEGVESPEALRRLRDIGCDITQGFLFTRPLPVLELRAWLAEHAASRRSKAPA